VPPSLDEALAHCYRALERRDQTTAQLEHLLERHGCDAKTAHAALAELRRQGAVDDVRYTRNFVHDRRTLDGWGSERIRERLEQAGVTRELVDEAVGEQDGETEMQAAVALLARRMPEPPTDDGERARALGFLLRKGYALELAHDAVRAFERGT
jgi:regulatory protein